MEGLLQSLKFEDQGEAAQVRLLVGSEAKQRGQEAPPWQGTQTLWWKGVPMHRGSTTYWEFLQAVYSALYTQDEEARSALVATSFSVLTHRVGEPDPTQTILTNTEFCRLLEMVRRDLYPHYRNFYKKLSDKATERTTRHRWGSWREARRRLRGVTSYEQLVDLPGFMGPIVVPTQGQTGSEIALGRMYPDGSVEVQKGPLYDMAYVYAHESGHVFDVAFLDDDQRDRFCEMIGIGFDSKEWTCTPYFCSPQEAFAEAYAMLACTGPWRNKCWGERYWDRDEDAAVLGLTRALVEEAKSRRPALVVRSS
jgi:hypothetical protein